MLGSGAAVILLCMDHNFLSMIDPVQIQAQTQKL